MRGFDAMQKKVNPSAVICLGEPFPDMQGNIVAVDYLKTRRVNRNGR